MKKNILKLKIRRDFAAILVLAAAIPACGAPKSWNSASNGVWSLDSNWTPPGMPAIGDDVTLGDVAGTEGTRTTMDINGFVKSLTMLNGNDLDTASFELFVGGTVSLNGAGTTLLLNPNNNGVDDSFDADSLDLTASGYIRMLGGRLEIDGDTGDGRLDITNGTLWGFGAIDLEAPWAGSKFTLGGGSLTAGHTTDGMVIVIMDPARTLEINATDPGSTVDLDQGGSTLTVRAAGTLDLNVPLNDPFSSTINLARKSTLDIADPWSFDGTMNVNTQAGTFIQQTAGPTMITGGEMTQDGGSINLDDPADHLIFDTNYTGAGGTINHDAGTIQFDSGGLIANTDFQVGSATKLIVNGYVLVEDDDWNWDGDGGTNNIITINDTGTLIAYITSASADDEWNGLMNINGGFLQVEADNNDWEANGTIIVGGTTQSTIYGDRMIKRSGTLTVSSGANLNIDTTSDPAGDSGQLFSGGTVTVHGVLDLNGDFTEWAGSTVNGTGRIEPGHNTVSADQTISVATYDWDTGDTTINSGVTLTLDVDAIEQGTADGFDSTLNLDSGSVAVNTPDPWRMEGTANLNNTGGGNPTINGSRLIVGDAGGATVNVTGGLSIIWAPLTVETNGTIDIATGATLNANGNTIHDGGTITGAGTYNPPSGDNNSVVSNSTIDVDFFNFDRSDWTIDPHATLDVSVVDYDSDAATDAFDATITINSGTASVNSDDTEFIMNDTINLNNTTGTPATWSGDPIWFGDDSGTLDSNLNVGGAGLSRISADITFYSDADVHIVGGATLQTDRVTFESVNGAENAEFTGTGTWQMTGANTVNEATTINMTGGTVDLDNSAISWPSGANDTTIRANLTINAATLADYGHYVQMPAPIPPENSHLSIINATLTVMLDDPAAEWTVNSDGIMRYMGYPGGTFLAGSDLNMDGTLDIDLGSATCDSRIDISGTANIDSGCQLRLSGGTTTPGNRNRLIGGTINGPGCLGADSNSALVGYGTINADVDFDGTTRLFADDGTLTVTGSILDAHYVGTADSDGILDVVNAWDTGTIAGLVMYGGELKGGTITLGTWEGLMGHGLVSAKIINNTRCMAHHSGQTLVLGNTSNDWDGTTGTGSLIGATGTLELHDTSSSPFNGTVSANNGGTVFMNGFFLDMQPSSCLKLTRGTFKRAGAGGVMVPIRGTVEVGPGTSTLLDIRESGGFLFYAVSAISLVGDLELNAPYNRIQSGATFTGGGVLRNLKATTLLLQDGVTMGVQLDNDGRLILGSSPGQASGTVFTQSASGTLDIEIAGTNPSDIDSLALSSSAQLDGTLHLSLLDGFTPGLGQTFTILTALSLTGEFDTVVQPPTMPAGLEFEVVYNPTNVWLQVVSASTSFQDWIDSFTSLTNPADKTKTANPDGDRMNNLTEFAFDDNPTTGAASGKIVGRIAPVGGVDVMTLTFPVRSGATSAAGDPPGGELVLEQTTDGLVYTVQATNDLVAFTLTVGEITGADATSIQAGLPTLHMGWNYRTFRSPGPVAGDPGEFMRVLISE